MRLSHRDRHREWTAAGMALGTIFAREAAVPLEDAHDTERPNIRYPHGHLYDVKLNKKQSYEDITGASPKGSRLSRKLPEKSVASWGINV